MTCNVAVNGAAHTIDTIDRNELSTSIGQDAKDLSDAALTNLWKQDRDRMERLERKLSARDRQVQELQERELKDHNSLAYLDTSDNNTDFGSMQHDAEEDEDEEEIGTLALGKKFLNLLNTKSILETNTD